MDKIEKVLKALTAKERRAVVTILEKLQKGDFAGLDVQKLHGQEDIFRVRKGKLRIIFRRARNGAIFILAIERRSEKTYRNF